MTDIRSIATKNRIKMGLLSCMKEKSYDTILNKDIISKAQISPRTYYHYYSDKNIILQEIEAELLKGIKKANDLDYQYVTEVNARLTDQANVELAEKEFKHIIDFCTTNKDVLNILLSTNGDINFLIQVWQLVSMEAKRRIDFLNQNNFIDVGTDGDIPVQIVHNVYTGAVLETIITWLQNKNDLTPYQVRKILGRVQVESPADLLLYLKRKK
ncbi:MAG: TetR family transcriptional regulator C-terminal domain-containing protein [Lactobacillus crispatus]|jgi:AcrR family transcriptional regulator|nr:TetR family transcriptional regulator C-terminal domain-containing protein [Lactobacillus crispatus]MCI1336666.1 TetR family transcriptional regulator C-terminal domain-containing protein [Lactobacillus crispatus]MCI1366215.1 TetR family transcriptional regulator C-terminal domain-containing protein [Lactobacillus crispatus]MCI1494575.1 TetR family transcriptional regulator C-terminal domain-containing protein [Lactobacillus crispatus]MCI1524770.1 TetR family transcriptional regulator C-term